MKVTVKYSGKKEDPGMEYEAWCSVDVEGGFGCSARNLWDCSEDANLGRDLGFVYLIPAALAAAHAAGAAGEPFVLEEIEEAD